MTGCENKYIVDLVNLVQSGRTVCVVVLWHKHSEWSVSRHGSVLYRSSISVVIVVVVVSVTLWCAHEFSCLQRVMSSVLAVCHCELSVQCVNSLSLWVVSSVCQQSVTLSCQFCSQHNCFHLIYSDCVCLMFISNT